MVHFILCPKDLTASPIFSRSGKLWSQPEEFSGNNSSECSLLSQLLNILTLNLLRMHKSCFFQGAPSKEWLWWDWGLYVGALPR